jgi:hypothetical protein
VWAGANSIHRRGRPDPTAECRWGKGPGRPSDRPRDTKIGGPEVFGRQIGGDRRALSDAGEFDPRRLAVGPYLASALARWGVEGQCVAASSCSSIRSSGAPDRMPNGLRKGGRREQADELDCSWLSCADCRPRTSPNEREGGEQMNRTSKCRLKGDEDDKKPVIPPGTFR